MDQKIFEFGISQARTISRNLYYYDTENGRKQEIKTHFLFLPLKSLPHNLPTGPNPRFADIDAKPCKQMFETLEREPELFTDCNRGLFLVAEKVYYPNGDAKKIIVDFGADEEGNVKGGLVDGNHTYTVLRKVSSDPTLSDMPIFMSIIEGAEQFANKLARARNTSVQVKENAMANLNHEFEPIKQALGKYSKKIIWTQNENIVNEEAVVPVEDLMAMMTALNLGLYDAEHQPTVAYTGTATCLNKWLNKKNRSSYEKLYDILPTVVETYEYLYKEYEKFAKDGGIRRFGGINGVEKERGKGKNRKKLVITLPFTGSVVDYKLANGFILPIFAALRFLLEDKSGKYHWAIEPEDFLKRHGSRLISKVLDAHSNENASNPNKTGKSKMLWDNLAQSVINQSLQEQLTKSKQ